MIKHWKNKGLEQFFVSGSKKGIQAAHAKKLRRLLDRLDDATKPEDMNVPGWEFHPLHGPWAGQYAVSVSGNWRVVFAFEGNDAVLVDYKDYH